MVEFIALVFMVFVVVYLFILFKKPNKQTHVPVTHQLSVPLPLPLPEETSETTQVVHHVKNYQPQPHKQPQQAIYLREGFDSGSTIDFTSPLDSTSAWLAGQVASRPFPSQTTQSLSLTNVPIASDTQLAIGPDPEFSYTGNNQSKPVGPVPIFSNTGEGNPPPTVTTVEMIPFGEQFQEQPIQEETSTEGLPPCTPIHDNTYGCVIGTCVKGMGSATFEQCQTSCAPPAKPPKIPTPSPSPCPDGTKPCHKGSLTDPCGPLPRPMIPCTEGGSTPDGNRQYRCYNKVCQPSPKNLPSHLRHKFPYKDKSDCLQHCESCHSSQMCNPGWGNIKDGVPCGPLPVRQTSCPEEEFKPKNNYGCVIGTCTPGMGKQTKSQCEVSCRRPPLPPSPSPTPSCIIPGVPTPGGV
jgi:hypothetical protein